MIKRLMTFILLAVAVIFSAAAQTPNTPQLNLICADVKLNATANAARQVGDVTSLYFWLNSQRSPVTLAWFTVAPEKAVEEAPSYTAYDTLVTGKRDSWVLFLRSPRDFTKAKVRNWVVDVWGNATSGSNAEAILQAGTFNATNAQVAIGGTARSTGTVSALDLTFPYQASPSVAEWLVQTANCN